MKTAGEGGPYGMALLVAYMLRENKDLSLDSFLSEKVFNKAEITVMQPDPNDVEGFNKYIDTYKSGLGAEEAAVKLI